MGEGEIAKSALDGKLRATLTYNFNLRKSYSCCGQELDLITELLAYYTSKSCLYNTQSEGGGDVRRKTTLFKPCSSMAALVSAG